MAQYLVDCARLRGWELDDNAVESLKWVYQELMKTFPDKYQLIVVTDSLLSGTYVEQVGIGKRLLTPTVVWRETDDLGGLGLPWRFIYYRRFPWTLNQKRFYGYWLDELCRGGSGEEQLESAIEVIHLKLKKYRQIEEWPHIDDEVVYNERELLIQERVREFVNS
jgi:hypothetical protein